MAEMTKRVKTALEKVATLRNGLSNGGGLQLVEVRKKGSTNGKTSFALSTNGSVYGVTAILVTKDPAQAYELVAPTA